MEFNANSFSPFGPLILEADCPDFIVNSLNEYVDDYNNSPEETRDNYLNLLSRNIPNIFVKTDFADEIGLLDYMEYLAEQYIREDMKRSLLLNSNSNSDIESAFDKIESLNVSELDGKEAGYIDGWVNIYKESDFTPLHTHGGSLSSVMILKVPDDPEGVNNRVNDFNEVCPNGKLNYNYIGSSSSTPDYSNDSYAPSQYPGKTIIFPPGLKHVYYPHKLNGQERRTLSLNFNIEYKEDCN